MENTFNFLLQNDDLKYVFKEIIVVNKQTKEIISEYRGPLYILPPPDGQSVITIKKINGTANDDIVATYKMNLYDVTEKSMPIIEDIDDETKITEDQLKDLNNVVKFRSSRYPMNYIVVDDFVEGNKSVPELLERGYYSITLSGAGRNSLTSGAIINQDTKFALNLPNTAPGGVSRSNIATLQKSVTRDDLFLLNNFTWRRIQKNMTSEGEEEFQWEGSYSYSKDILILSLEREIYSEPFIGHPDDKPAGIILNKKIKFFGIVLSPVPKLFIPDEPAVSGASNEQIDAYRDWILEHTPSNRQVIIAAYLDDDTTDLMYNYLSKRPLANLPQQTPQYRAAVGSTTGLPTTHPPIEDLIGGVRETFSSIDYSTQSLTSGDHGQLLNLINYYSDINTPITYVIGNITNTPGTTSMGRGTTGSFSPNFSAASGGEIEDINNKTNFGGHGGDKVLNTYDFWERREMKAGPPEPQATIESDEDYKKRIRRHKLERAYINIEYLGVYAAAMRNITISGDEGTEENPIFSYENDKRDISTIWDSPPTERTSLLNENNPNLKKVTAGREAAIYFSVAKRYEVDLENTYFIDTDLPEEDPTRKTKIIEMPDFDFVKIDNNRRVIYFKVPHKGKNYLVDLAHKDRKFYFHAVFDTNIVDSVIIRKNDDDHQYKYKKEYEDENGRCLFYDDIEDNNTKKEFFFHAGNKLKIEVFYKNDDVILVKDLLNFYIEDCYPLENGETTTQKRTRLRSSNKYRITKTNKAKQTIDIDTAPTRDMVLFLKTENLYTVSVDINDVMSKNLNHINFLNSTYFNQTKYIRVWRRDTNNTNGNGFPPPEDRPVLTPTTALTPPMGNWLSLPIIEKFTYGEILHFDVYFKYDPILNYNENGSRYFILEENIGLKSEYSNIFITPRITIPSKDDYYDGGVPGENSSLGRLQKISFAMPARNVSLNLQDKDCGVTFQIKHDLNSEYTAGGSCTVDYCFPYRNHPLPNIEDRHNGIPLAGSNGNPPPAFAFHTSSGGAANSTTRAQLTNDMIIKVLPRQQIRIRVLYPEGSLGLKYFTIDMAHLKQQNSEIIGWELNPNNWHPNNNSTSGYPVMNNKITPYKHFPTEDNPLRANSNKYSSTNIDGRNHAFGFWMPDHNVLLFLKLIDSRIRFNIYPNLSQFEKNRTRVIRGVRVQFIDNLTVNTLPETIFRPFTGQHQNVGTPIPNNSNGLSKLVFDNNLNNKSRAIKIKAGTLVFVTVQFYDIYQRLDSMDLASQTPFIEIYTPGEHAGNSQSNPLNTIFGMSNNQLHQIPSELLMNYNNSTATAPYNNQGGLATNDLNGIIDPNTGARTNNRGFRNNIEYHQMFVFIAPDEDLNLSLRWEERTYQINLNITKLFFVYQIIKDKSNLSLAVRNLTSSSNPLHNINNMMFPSDFPHFTYAKVYTDNEHSPNNPNIEDNRLELIFELILGLRLKRDHNTMLILKQASNYFVSNSSSLGTGVPTTPPSFQSSTSGGPGGLIKTDPNDRYFRLVTSGGTFLMTSGDDPTYRFEFPVFKSNLNVFLNVNFPQNTIIHSDFAYNCNGSIVLDIGSYTIYLAGAHGGGGGVAVYTGVRLGRQDECKYYNGFGHYGHWAKLDVYVTTYTTLRYKLGSPGNDGYSAAQSASGGGGGGGGTSNIAFSREVNYRINVAGVLDTASSNTNGRRFFVAGGNGGRGERHAWLALAFPFFELSGGGISRWNLSLPNIAPKYETIGNTAEGGDGGAGGYNSAITHSHTNIPNNNRTTIPPYPHGQKGREGKGTQVFNTPMVPDGGTPGSGFPISPVGNHPNHIEMADGRSSMNINQNILINRSNELNGTYSRNGFIVIVHNSSPHQTPNVNLGP